MSAPDLPTVPRQGWTRGTAITAVVMAVLVGVYGFVAFTGFEPAVAERSEIPPNVRASPGGYRTYHFWHSGYHGGK